MTDQGGNSTELAKPVALQPMIEQYAGEFGKILPTHIGQERYARWCLTFLRHAVAEPATDAQRRQVEAWHKVLASPMGQLSVMRALMDCASLGLEPGRTYHLVPFKGQVTGITDYKGEIELIYRAGRFPVVAQLVREQDTFGMRGANTPPLHEADWFGSRGEIVGGYAYCQFRPDVYSLVVIMTEADFRQQDRKSVV